MINATLGNPYGLHSVGVAIENIWD